ncbi:MAG: HDOD domain-containing protein [Candidatus Scalinduaceae bacterium]
MKRVLFVDDDKNALQGFKRMLRPMRYEWEMEYAMSGEDALNFMSQVSYDAVVSNMRMSRMNGIELLSIVMEHYPETVRIILSENSDREMVMKAIKCTHQFLIKPCDAETMKYTIERACKLRDLLRNEALKKMVTGIRDLPSLPRLYNKIIREMQSSDPSLKKAARIIAQDISMSAKILQLVNSAYFGLPQKIINPEQASIYLGTETLKALVLCVHVFSSFTEEAELSGFSMADMWKHSLLVGRLAKDIASSEMVDKDEAEEALIAGILHDIGKLILLKVPEQRRKVNEFIEWTGCDLVEAEYAFIETSHAETGAYLLGLWGLNDNIVEAVAFHHNPSNLLENIFIDLNKPSNQVVGKTNPKYGDLELRSAKKYLKGFTTLTAVHIANSLMMQKDCSSDITDYSYVDMLYLRTLNMEDRLPEWAEYYKRLVQEDVQEE